MPVIGYLGIGSRDTEVPLAAFRQGLSEAGYVEGQNVTIDYRWAEGNPERFPALAAELVMLKVHVILTTGGTLAAIAAKQATATIPIVFTAAGDPVAEGLVANLARPGGNVTGFSVTLDDLIGKWLELLKEAVPGASRVALLLKPDAMPDRVREVRLREADASARALGMELQVFEARGREDFDGVSRICPKRAWVLWSCGQHPYSNLSDDASRISRQSIGCRLSSRSRTMSRLAASCPTDRTLLI
jgi:putative ABC transport system substrate-binding protein